MKKPDYIKDEARASMSWKEQDLVILLREKRYSRKQIMRKLYITSDYGYYKLRQRVRDKIKRYNET